MCRDPTSNDFPDLFLLVHRTHHRPPALRRPKLLREREQSPIRPIICVFNNEEICLLILRSVAERECGLQTFCARIHKRSNQQGSNKGLCDGRFSERGESRTNNTLSVIASEKRGYSASVRGFEGREDDRFRLREFLTRHYMMFVQAPFLGGHL
eukprot:c33963_g1_i1 orf=199-660(+)